jgi:ABC-2 type transport system permease protein
VVQLWDVIGVITLFVAPFLSMRLFAEEKRNRTFELLMTAPVRPWEIVLGKYLGGVGVIWATLGLTIIFPITLSLFGSSESGTALEWSTVALGFGGLLLWGATCLGVGMFVSASPRARCSRPSSPSPSCFPGCCSAGLAQSADEPWRSIANHLSFSSQLSTLSRGVLDLKAAGLLPLGDPLLAPAHPSHGGSAALGLTDEHPHPGKDPRSAWAWWRCSPPPTPTS